MEVHWGCYGKKAYDCWTKAARMLRRKSGRRKRLNSSWTSHSRLEVYRCRYCHHWHVGTSGDVGTTGRPTPKARQACLSSLQSYEEEQA